MKFIYIFLILIIAGSYSKAQDAVEKHLTSARSAYDSKDLQEARFALQETLRELDIIIGKEILKIFPENFDRYTFNKEEDHVMGGSGDFTGLNVSRNYYDPQDSIGQISLNLINNSPLISTINAFLTNPLFMNRADESQKVVRVDGFKGLLTKQTTGENHSGYQLQVPFGQSLLTLDCSSINQESRVMDYAEKIEIKRIATLAGGN